jgi:hypothetical protein
VRCHGTKSPLLTALFLSFFLPLHLLFSQKGLSLNKKMLLSKKILADHLYYQTFG